MRYDLRAMARRRGVRRQGVELRPMEPTKALARPLEAIAAEIIRAAEQAIREALLPVYAPRPAITRDDNANSIGDALAGVSNVLRRLVIGIGPAVRRWAVQVEEWHRPRFAANVKAGTGVEAVAFLTSADAEDQVAAAAEWAAGLITSISEDLQKDVASLTWAAYGAQTPREELAKQLQERLGIARSRARFIARDQTTKLAAALDRMRQQEAGIDSYRWRHSGKAHPRPEHVRRDGKIFRWSDPPPGGHPGTEPNCFPSGQPVWFHDDVLRIWRRWHSGEATTLITGAGESVRCTPNHPVLTQSGWKPAHSIKVGDDLVQVGFGCFDTAHVKVEERQPRIGDVFEAAKALFASITFDAHGGDFHGDASADENVEVVNTGYGLRRHLIAAYNEMRGKAILENPEVTAEAFASLCALPLLGDRVPATADSRMRRARALEALLWREGLHREGGRSAAVSQLNALALEHFGYGVAAYADALAESFDALAGPVGQDRARLIVLAAIVGRAADTLRIEVAPGFEMLGKSVPAEADNSRHVSQQFPGLHMAYHRVENVITRPWEGHVFNLETASGWYHAGFLAVRNCGCRAQAYVDLT